MLPPSAPSVSLVLGSASPARLATLQRAGVTPYVLVSHVDEDSALAHAVSQYGDLEPGDVALVLARTKCEAVAARLAGDSCPQDAPTGALVLGCDSVLEIDGELHGKPADEAEATSRWRRMRGSSGLTRANRLVTTFEPAEDGAGGVGEVGFEGEALAVDLDGC